LGEGEQEELRDTLRLPAAFCCTVIAASTPCPRTPSVLL
jgi:hypothetical protein